MELHDSDVSLESVLITEGAQGAIDLLLGTDIRERKILVEDPSYNIVLSYLRIKNIPHETVMRTKEGIDLDRFEEIVKTGEIQFFYTMSRNHNPLGTDLR